MATLTKRVLQRFSQPPPPFLVLGKLVPFVTACFPSRSACHACIAALRRAPQLDTYLFCLARDPFSLSVSVTATLRHGRYRL